jgi:hypothetical protein
MATDELDLHHCFHTVGRGGGQHCGLVSRQRRTPSSHRGGRTTRAPQTTVGFSGVDQTTEGGRKHRDDPGSRIQSVAVRRAGGITLPAATGVGGFHRFSLLSPFGRRPHRSLQAALAEILYRHGVPQPADALLRRDVGALSRQATVDGTGCRRLVHRTDSSL